MNSDKPSFAIMGSGGVGGYFGAMLARGGHDTTFIARGAHLQAIRTAGLRLEDPDEAFTLSVNATDRPAGIGPVDFVIFSVKLWDTETAAEACRPLIGPRTAVLSLQNGVDSETVLAGVLGDDHVMGGVAEISATVTEPGAITCISPFRRIRFGELDGEATDRSQRLAAALTQSGIEHHRPDDIRVAIWTKFIFLVGLSALTALTRQPIGVIRADPDTRRLLETVIAEARTVAAAIGIPLDADIVARQMTFVDTLPAEMRASMAIDLAQGRRLELPWLSGAVVRLGAAHGVSTPANGFVSAALKLQQDGTAQG